MGFLDIFKPSTIKKGADVIFAKAMEHSTATTVIGSTIGLAATVVLTWRARPKVDRILEEKRHEIEEINDDPFLTDEEKAEERKKTTRHTLKELVVVSAPVVICATATAGFNIGMAVYAGKAISKWHEAAIVSDAMYQDLFKATKEEVGEEKMQEIQEKAAQNKVERDYPFFEVGEYWPDGIIQARGGSQVFYDHMTGMVFRSDEKTIMEVCNYMNTRLASGQEPFFTYNEFLAEMCLPQVGCAEAFIFGGLSMTSALVPHLYNTAKINQISVTVLDWSGRPTVKP